MAKVRRQRRPAMRRRLKMIMKVQMDCKKSRKKALMISTGVDGVISACLEKDNLDQLVVTGDDGVLDLVSLTKHMRKKVGYTELVSLEYVKPKPQEEAKEQKNNIDPCCSWISSSFLCFSLKG
ncbi:hypothetical protein MRB53_032222 [Persea americana]|uniref:Uncharacterized protein n=1 Tax=Persea americana TaxID=3435 RepID=A0ACC2KRK2_PERAE|nr:hypothetical protein MRB53_032222 [Persea americana]|eukprot:TRINITY_DN6085_c1_g2_i1.p1 TRINITY_DN6085_c1_g2~~TRINITY_DN6085_c1_g2_i1.p1  ORF type:complete len:123 (+),score=22.97 TRINITY_DN6085_c1_g2_i1:260-628(+)